jgi:hypothetical protein
MSEFKKYQKTQIAEMRPVTEWDIKAYQVDKEEPKQETLEKLAKSQAIYELENNYKPIKESFKLACKRNFIRGAKWQQEQIYNEIKELYDNENITGFSKRTYAQCLDIVEQFKKK